MAKAYDPNKWKKKKNKTPISAQAVKSAIETQEFFDTATDTDVSRGKRKFSAAAAIPALGGLSDLGKEGVASVIGGRPIGKNITAGYAQGELDSKLAGVLPGIGAGGDAAQAAFAPGAGDNQVGGGGALAGAAGGEQDIEKRIHNILQNPNIQNLIARRDEPDVAEGSESEEPEAEGVGGILELFRRRYPNAYKKMSEDVKRQIAIKKLDEQYGISQTGE